jgi:predicted Zn-dependent protease
MSFLKFERGFESEADFLGLQYMYAAGYDPTASIDIFERLLALQRTKPGALARVFSTHPMNEDRIRKTQQEIEDVLKPKPEYVVNTSEYLNARDRLLAVENQRRQDGQTGPRLRVNPGAQPDGSGDQRPTIRRHELVD